MKKLEIVNYVDTQSKIIQPFIQECNSSSNYWEVLKNAGKLMDRSKSENKEKVQQAFINYYIDLLTKGHSFEEMDTLLRKTFSNQAQYSNRKGTLDFIMKEREILEVAYQKYNEEHYKLEYLIWDTSHHKKSKFTKKRKR